MIELDASVYMEVFNAGLEAGFMLANNTNELEEQLNINQIDTSEDE